MLVLLELLTVLRGLSLRPSREHGVLSYTAAAPDAGPPLMVLGILVVLLAASVVVWWKQRCP